MYKKLFLILALIPAIVQADWFGETVQVECTKPLGYFAIQRVTYRGEVAAYAKEKGLQSALQPYGIYVGTAKGSCILGKDTITWEIAAPHFAVSLSVNGTKMVDAVPLGVEYRGNVAGFSYTSEYKPGVAEFSVLGEWQDNAKRTLELPKIMTKEWLHKTFVKCRDHKHCVTQLRFRLNRT